MKTLLSAAVIATILCVPAHAEKLLLDIRKAEPVASFTGVATLLIEVDDNGRQGLHELTSKHIGEVIKFYLDGELVLSPTIREPITDGIIQVSGGLNQIEVDEMAARLKADGGRIKVVASD